MSRKNYKGIAEAIRSSLDEAIVSENIYGVAAVADTAQRIAAALKADNPNFRYDVFYEACGLNEWGEERSNG